MLGTIFASNRLIEGSALPAHFRKDDDVANEQQSGRQLSAQGAARRRFTRAGAAASGVLLTLHSQPGMAQLVCATPSGAASALVSARNPDPITCSGLSPGIWLQSLKSNGKSGHNPGHLTWPVPPATEFGSIFPTGKAIGRASLQEVLGNHDSTFDPDNLGAHLTAAYLNTMSGRSTFLSENMLRTIWNELQVHPYVYVPTAGAQGWSGADVVDYLKSTMHQVKI
ncbi:MAG: hypothetical protein K0R43_700 [Pseudoduganella sp.]|jgi:hypothetical protein|nr:hypothetical protein [Pseudoduganella sp.]